MKCGLCGVEMHYRFRSIDSRAVWYCVCRGKKVE